MPTTQYTLKPGISVQANNPFNDIELAKGVTFRLQSNSSGFRAKDFHAKTAGVTRIVTLGDSSTFGWGVDSYYTYQALLEPRLREDNRAHEVGLYEDLYGHEAMEANWHYYVTTDGCHPGRAGHSLIADALTETIAQMHIRENPDA